MDRIIFHIDVNSAYLSWTSVENLKQGCGPDLRELLAIIGGDQASRRGVVLAKSVPAKALGVKTGEPIVSALRKCPDLMIFPPDHKLYSRYSRRLMEYLKNLTPDVEQVSIDECYLDFTGIAHRYPSPLSAAVRIKKEIFTRFDFTVNIGISSNKLLAKMASDFEKPDKVHTLFPREIPQKMWPLPVEKLYMAGRSSVDTFHKLGIRTIGDLASTDPGLLESHLKSHGRLLWEYANGQDSAPVLSGPQEAKGIGNSTTLSEDVSTLRDAQAVLLQLAESVSARLRKVGQVCTNLCVEIKYNTFVTVSHQAPVDPPTNTCGKIYQTSCSLFSSLWNHTPIRLLGIRATKLLPEDTPIQLSLFDLGNETDERQKRLDKALDSIKQRFGDQAVVRGSMLKPPAVHLQDRNIGEDSGGD